MRRFGLAVAALCAWTTLARANLIIMTPNTVDVGNVVIGGMGTATGTLSASDNTGHVDLVLQNNCPAFAVPTDDIRLGTPKPITVTFAPTTRGTQTCNVDVKDHLTNNVRTTFTVRGVGQLPPTISVGAPPSFATVRFNNAAPIHTAMQNVIVSNVGDVDLSITNVAIAGTNAADFSITSGGTTGLIIANNSKTWGITFDPLAAGLRSATLTFASNDPSNPSVTVALSGSGSTGVIGVNDLSFGVVNIGSSSSLDIAVTNTGVAPKGNLGVTSAAINGASSWFKFSACGGTQSCTFAPALSIAMSTVVGITCNPPIAANAGDMQTATVTFTSDTDATADTISTVGCTAGKSALATTTGSVTFSSQLVTTQSTSMPVTVTNSGNVAATFYFRVTGASAAAFSVSTGSGCGTGATNLCALPASGGSVSFDLTFTPTAEGDISAGLDLVANSSPFPQLVLAGRGIDRHIAMPASVDFPDTFRNPSPTAMAVPVTVSNIGEYPLHVTDVTVVDAPIWTLADATTSFDVPGLGTHDVMVRFAPIAAGKTPAGMLAITSDDRTNPMLHVVLTGIGKDRDIEVGPATIDFGDRSVGVSTRLSEIQPGPLMSILNRDDTATFRLREVIATGDSVFAAETTDGGSASDIDLAPGDTRDLDVVFAPSTEGEFRADLMIYLDDDPVAQTSVAVHGRALTADIHGGGGCDAADPGGAFAVALVLAALALAARKRLPGVRRR